MLDRVGEGPLPVDYSLVRFGLTKPLGALAFLAPDIQRALLEGRQPAGLTLQALLDCELPLSWVEQRSKLGFPPQVTVLAA